MKKIFKIDGMHCGSCAMMIDGDLEDCDGVTSANTNLVKEITEVEFDEKKVTPEKIVEIIKKSGYSASLA